jgi:YVTN family beta-propeller protein
MQDEYILVLNTLSGDISIIDPKDDSVVGAVRVGEKPRDLVYLPGSSTI